MTDAAARERIRASLDESLFVEAAAGTGKTSELVRRIVAVIATGRTTIDRIAAVTFTRKAAGELKLRLRQELDTARLESEGEAASRIEVALAMLEEAHVGTIHSFCAEILRQRPVEARVAPEFEELDESKSRALFKRVFNSWIQDTLRNLPPGIRRVFARTNSRRDRDGQSPLDELRAAGWRLVEWRDFRAPWSKPSFDRGSDIDRLLPQILACAVIAQTSRRTADELHKALQPVVEFQSRLHMREELRQPRDDDDMEGRLVRLQKDLERGKRDQRRSGGRYSKEYSRQEAEDSRDKLIASLKAFAQKCDADLAAVLRDELGSLVDRYEATKAQSGKLDFVDLLIHVRNLMRSSRDVREFLQSRFTHVFIDEFQDTDPVQVEILLLLVSEDPSVTDWRSVRPRDGKLFIVGDPKQSIYRFRRADVRMYTEVRQMLMERSVGLVQLSRSFRSVRPIQNAVNAAFAAEMVEDLQTGQPAYISLDGDPAFALDQPSVVALPVAKPYSSYGRITKQAIQNSLPDTIAAFVEWLLRQSGWKVRDLDSDDLVPIAPRHICMLFRHFIYYREDSTRPFVHALEARDIPHLLWGARSFHQREEVECVRTALTAIEWPDDELTVYATLRGSLFAIADSMLLQWKDAVGSLHPFRILDETQKKAFGPIAEALEILSSLHRRRAGRPIVETVNELLEATRAHAGLAMRPAGHQVLANVYRVADMARRYEMNGGLSFRGFVDMLEEEAERTDTAESPAWEDAAEGVRLMTVHAAKGLEFPIVILADMRTHLSPARPDKYVDVHRGLCAIPLIGCTPLDVQEREDEEKRANDAEGIRIAYVAATRARDLLVIPTVGDALPGHGSIDGWVKPLERVIYPLREHKRFPEERPEYAHFGETSVLERPEDSLGEVSVKPGMHKPAAGEHRVLWMDPSLLRLSVESNFGLRQERILAPDPSGANVREVESAYRDWLDDRAAVQSAGARSTVEVFSATEDAETLVTLSGGIGSDVQIELVRRGTAHRPAGRRFGTLVHSVLASIELRAARSAVESLVDVQGRALGCPETERKAAADAVVAALRHPMLQKAASAARVFREYPITVRAPDGRILEGVIDLMFEADGVWTLADFKTDADQARRLQKYQRQVGWYCYAIQQWTSQPVHGWVLGV